MLRVHVVSLGTIQTTIVLISWDVLMLHCDWHSGFRAVRPVMLLTESVFINHHNLYIYIHLSPAILHLSLLYRREPE